MSLAYCDWSSQEIAIAAALSGDELLWKAYESGDPYIAFAIQAGLVPSDATKETHKVIRNRCKSVVLDQLWNERLWCSSLQNPRIRSKIFTSKTSRNL